MKQKKILMIIISIILLLFTSKCAIVTTVDFLLQPTDTGSTYFNNFIGAVTYMQQMLPYMNSTLYQGYSNNSNLKGTWNNNFAITLRTPKGWFYNCSEAGVDPTDHTKCIKQLQENTTFWSQFGEYIWNTQNQPFWTYGLNNQHLNFTNATFRTSLHNYQMKIYKTTYNTIYILQMMYQADHAVANGMRTGTYTVDDFYKEAYQYQQILFGLFYKAPGISQTSPIQWITRLPQYFDNVWRGIYTLQSVIFMDPTLATIQHLLDDNYTRGYLRRRFKVNQTFTYTSFGFFGSVSLSRVRLTNGEGIDGITNSLAAAFWWLDFIFQCAMMEMYDISIQGTIRAGNYQSMFGPAPTFDPTSLYYASIFAAYAGQQYPKIILPHVTGGTSLKIKSYGFVSLYVNKFLIINKDTNVSLVGKINIMAKSTKQVKAKCIYLQGPSLNSKADQITLAGHKYIGNNSTPQGTFKQFYFDYNSDIKAFSIDIKYAQAVLCQIPNGDIVIPVKQCYQSNFIYLLWLVLGFVGLFIML